MSQAAPALRTRELDRLPPPTEDGRMRFTVADYRRMIEAGILTEDHKVELLDGEIVFMASIGYSHLSVTDMLNMHFTPKVAGRMICRVQGSIAVSELSEPEPDFLILDHVDDFYRSRSARVDEVRLLVEVADSSLEQDLKRKRKIYAEAGVVEYWVIDVAESRLVRHLEPRGDGTYGAVSEHRAPEKVEPTRVAGTAVDLRWLLG